METGTRRGNEQQDRAGSAPDGPDWATGLVDSLESVVGAIRSRTTDPIARVARIVVFAALGFGVVLTLLLVTVIGSVRLLDSYLPGQVWSAHLVVGGIFFVAGMLLWGKRKSALPRSS